jgi:hypothetical protein
MSRRMERLQATGIALGLAGLLVVGLQVAPTLHAQIGSGTDAPYAGQQSSSVPGLSEAEIASLRSGGGMGLARPGEINGYPGPRHVLDLADELALSADQRVAAQALFNQMQAEAVALGADFLSRYAVLEQSFRNGTATIESVQQQTAEIGQVEGQIRATHLKYHLLTKPLLTPDQVAAYSHLRGYTDGAAPVQHTPGMQH